MEFARAHGMWGGAERVGSMEFARAHVMWGGAEGLSGGALARGVVVSLVWVEGPSPRSLVEYDLRR